MNEEIGPTSGPAIEPAPTPAAPALPAPADVVTPLADTADPINVPVPGSDSSVNINKMVTEGNKVSVWTSSSTDLPPDFVIVNPPTQVYIDAQTTIDDPLGAIAYVIDGATK